MSLLAIPPLLLPCLSPLILMDMLDNLHESSGSFDNKMKLVELSFYCHHLLPPLSLYFPSLSPNGWSFLLNPLIANVMPFFFLNAFCLHSMVGIILYSLTGNFPSHLRKDIFAFIINPWRN